LGQAGSAYAAVQEYAKFSGLHAPATNDTCKERSSDSGDLFVCTASDSKRFVTADGSLNDREHERVRRRHKGPYQPLNLVPNERSEDADCVIDSRERSHAKLFTSQS
jgi:hypothetical protein